MKDNQVFTLSVQSTLDELAILSIKSWLTLKYSVVIYSYEVIDETVYNLFKDENVEFKDASTILTYPSKFKNYSEIADYFRFSKLEQEGGIWLDTDLILLKRLPCNKIIISSERCKLYGSCSPKDRLKTPNIAVLKFPPLHEMCSYIVNKMEKHANTGINQKNESTSHLIRIFQRRVIKYRNAYWQNVVEPDVFCPINWSSVYDLWHCQDLKDENKFGMKQKNADYILNHSCGIHLWRSYYYDRGYNHTKWEHSLYNKIKNLVELSYEIR